MWILVWTTLEFGIMYNSNIGQFETYDECIYNLHEAEIQINRPWESLYCIKDLQYVIEEGYS